ncbi:hypothetical protein [uncultured Lacinutrix sp.]|uniref:hypothetical protein n=1 Tax=uncultured Lacinutrix sp. TaxID=574032 RepID=UPI00262A034D|nr:hypothetical protein [uncultured Lacinutrix sp.]
MIHQYQLKGVLANKFRCTIILCILFFSCINKEQNQVNDDYLILNKIIKTTNTQVSNRITDLKLNNNNEYVVSIVNKLYKDEKKNNLKGLDSLKQDIGIIKGDSILDSIFNLKQYEHLISQKHNTKWDLKLVNELFKEKVDNENDSKMIYISKPIYSLDKKIALVGIKRKTSMSISIYKKTNGEWIEHRLIAPLIFQPKAEKFIYDN